MNEQLVVKNFGPITDATVDFKRVTVFIGPTGGGKSTLAKLAAVFRDKKYDYVGSKNYSKPKDEPCLSDYNMEKFSSEDSDILFNSLISEKFFSFEHDRVMVKLDDAIEDEIQVSIKENNKLLEYIQEILGNNDKLKLYSKNEIGEMISKSRENLENIITKNVTGGFPNSSIYIPAERVFLSAIEYSWAGLMRDDVGLPKILLEFANEYSLSRKNIQELDIPFFNVKYLHINGRDFIKIFEREEPLMLLEAASGIQSVTPLLVLLEHLSRNTEQAQSFIIEEPELNLYPTAQRDLVYWLLEKCTQGDNDLTITTHSPYVLSALNLALYAGKVAALFPHQRQKVTKIIPEKYWLKADEFSAYHVAGGGVKSIFDAKTGLLSESQLDEVSGHFADVFDRLTDLRVPEKKAPAKAKPVKK